MHSKVPLEPSDILSGSYIYRLVLYINVQLERLSLLQVKLSVLPVDIPDSII